jgi:hypothetical protein
MNVIIMFRECVAPRGNLLHKLLSPGTLVTAA